jgi:hypothetical protein
MPTLASSRAERQPARRPVAASRDQLHDLARRVRQLGRGNRRNPVESFILEKLDVASALDRLAEQAEGAR